MSESSLFPGFLRDDISTTGATIRTVRAGSGPPLLLLHGYPQTHVIWHKIARRLAENFSVVLTDLRGYGDSSKPERGERHQNYSFRAMAQDQLEVIRHLGHERFYVASHDRGARAAHRLCLDHPDAVRRVCFMDIVPTLRMYRDTSMEFATKYMWWFFLIQKAPLPERMIGADAEFFLDFHFQVQNATPGALTAEALEEYRRCFCTPETIHASCRIIGRLQASTSRWMTLMRRLDVKSRLRFSHCGAQRVRSGSSGTCSKSGASTRMRRWQGGL